MLMSTTICHRGLVRDQNEDCGISNELSQLWLVADGVGGNRGGKVASEMAVQTIDRRYRQGLSLEEAIVDANRVIAETSQQPELCGMATTIVAAGFSGADYQLAWVGDSRAYLVGPDEIRQLSSDHNIANALFQDGDIEEHELFDHPGQHELTQALGSMSLDKVPSLTGTLQDGQCLLLCTDGLSGVLNDQEILQSYRQYLPRSPKVLKQLADHLLQQVLAAGAPDNVCFTLIMRKHPVDSEFSVVSHAVNKDAVFQGRNAAAKESKKPVNKAPLTWLLLSIVVLIMLLLFLI